MSDNKRFMKFASDVSEQSLDPSTKVGAVITLGGRFETCGYNHVPDRVRHTDKDLENRTWKYPRTIHAEKHAILKIGYQYRERSDLCMYVTHFPCAECATLIAEVGIKEIFTKKVSPEMEERWGESFKISVQILKEAGIPVTFLD